jgi:hypothetical protein
MHLVKMKRQDYSTSRQKKGRVTAKGYRTLVTQHYPVAGYTQGTFDLVLAPARYVLQFLG